MTYVPSISDEEFARDLAEREARRGKPVCEGDASYWRRLAYEAQAEADALRVALAAKERAK